jgi:hypothetical protein
MVHHTTDDESTTDQPVACSLTPEAAERRLAWVEETMGDALRDITVESDHLVWTFDRTDEAIEGVTTLAEREAACCGFATIQVTIPPQSAVTFRMDVPEGAGPDLLTQFEDVGTPMDLR